MHKPHWLIDTDPGVDDALAILMAHTHHVGIGTLTRGATVVDWEDRQKRPPNARIVLDVDWGRFEAMVARALGAKSA